jgi:predicted transcriptional regulator
MPQKSIGDRELALLTFIANRGGATAGEASDEFGGREGLARSTVLTMIERLRRKGHLRRRQVNGIFRYVPRTPPVEAVRHAVRTFVENTLGGSVSPFVAYLTEHRNVSDAELAELEEMVASLQSKRQRGRR